MASRLPASSTLFTTLACAGLLLHVTLALSCPETQSPVLDDKVAGSEVVVQGRVRRQLKVRPQDGNYTAEVEVQCVFKGGPVASLVNITGVGRETQRCVQTELWVGRVYLIYLKRSRDGSNTFTPTFTQDPAERKYLDELKYACGLRVQLPQGVSESQVCRPETFVTDDELDDCPSAACSPVSTALFTATVIVSFFTCWFLRPLCF